MAKVGVLLPTTSADPGAYLADARALEAAGVDSVWVPAAPSGAVLIAAIAGVTTAVRLGVLAENSPEFAASSEHLATLRWLSRGRQLVGIQHDDTVVVEEPGERWALVSTPSNRESWQQSLATGEAAGVTGVLVPLGPRLLDILRRPLEEDDRRDLVLSQG